MKKEVFFIFLLLISILPALSASASIVNSTSYKQSVILSVGSENVSSSSYKTSIAIGIINGIVNSTSYINKLGFFHTLLLADNQPCTSEIQCEGFFCCSNLCASSSCPTGGGAPSGGGGGGTGAAAAGGGGGGGGAPIIQQIKDFSLSPGSVKTQLALGTAKIQKMTIKNTGSAALGFNLGVLTVSDFVFLSETSFSLEPGQEKTLEANIIGKKLGSYIGQIEVAGGSIKKYIDVIIDVESEQVLFDAKIDIPPAYKEVEAGSELKAQITLLNVGPPRKVDVTTAFIIKDKQGNVIYESSETFAVEKQSSFVKSFKLPKSMKPGGYLAIIEVRYENSFAVSSELFSVVRKEETTVQKAVKLNKAFFYALLISVGLIFLFLSLLVPKIKINKAESLDKYNRIIGYLEDAIAKNDIAKSKKLYAEARSLYIGLKIKDKKETYGRLDRLYKKMKSK